MILKMFLVLKTFEAKKKARLLLGKGPYWHFFNRFAIERTRVRCTGESHSGYFLKEWSDVVFRPRGDNRKVLWIRKVALILRRK